MNRLHWRNLAEERVKEAESLLNAGLWSGAYYLIGYSVEFALKACILGRVENSGVIFEDKQFSAKCWTHDLEKLAKLAGLDVERGLATSANPNLDLNWTIVKDWNEQARYENWNELEARKLFNAVTNETSGVLPWIMVRW